MAGSRQPITPSAPAATTPALAAPPQSAAAAMLGQELGVTFEQKHAELCAEAARVASECGAYASIYVLSPDGTRGACDRFPADWPWGKQAATITQMLDKDVATMGLEELKAYGAWLFQLSAALAARIQEIKTASKI